MTNKITSGFMDFCRGLKIIFKGTGKEEGNKSLARVSRVIMAQIDTFGANAVRRNVIRSIESDMRRKAKSGAEAVQDLINDAVNTPDYMKMLKRLGLDGGHIMVAAKQALREANKSGRNEIYIKEVKNVQ